MVEFLGNNLAQRLVQKILDNMSLFQPEPTSENLLEQLELESSSEVPMALAQLPVVKHTRQMASEEERTYFLEQTKLLKH